MNLFRLFLVSTFFIFISACSSDGEERPEYLDTMSVKGLEIPPTLSRPDSREELQIPEPSAKALLMLKEREDVEGSVAPLFKDIALKSDSGFYWLEVNDDADKLWPILRNFWANEGIEIDRDEPLLGFMETEWVKEYEKSKDAGFFGKMVKVFSADILDRFRLRIERVKSKAQTRVYISHRSMEIVVAEEGSSWQQAPANPALEKEMLYRLVLFAGLNKAKADEVFTDYNAYQPRISLIEGGYSEYEITGNFDFVWRRLLHSLDRLGVEVKNKNQSNGEIEVLVGKISDEFLQEDDEDLRESDPEDLLDLGDEKRRSRKESDSGFSFNLFGSDDKEKEVSVFVKLKPMSKTTYMQLSLAEKGLIEDGLAADFRSGLVGLLK